MSDRRRRVRRGVRYCVLSDCCLHTSVASLSVVIRVCGFTGAIVSQLKQGIVVVYRQSYQAILTGYKQAEEGKRVRPLHNSRDCLSRRPAGVGSLVDHYQSHGQTILAGCGHLSLDHRLSACDEWIILSSNRVIGWMPTGVERSNGPSTKSRTSSIVTRTICE